MGLNFHKSVKICKGVKVNLNKKSASVTLGGKGLHYTLSTTGRQTATVGLPGTGLSYSKTISSGKKSSSRKSSASDSNKTSVKTASAKTDSMRRSSSEMRRLNQEQLALEIQRQQEREADAQEAAAYKEYTDTITRLYLSCTPPADWEALRLYGQREQAVLAEEVLAGNMDAYLKAIESTHFFTDLAEYGCGFEFGTDMPECMEAEFQAMIKEVVPLEELSLTKTGRLSKKELSKTAYYAMAQDYVCSCVLRIARELFALLPVETVRVHVTDVGINSANGCEEEFTILSVQFDRETFSAIRFDYIDASDCVESFPHRMKFGKTTGFGVVERL